MIKTPHDAESLMDELPQDVLDQIQLELLISSGLSIIEMGQSSLSKKQLKKHMKRTMREHIRLLREAKIKSNKAGGV